MFELNGKTALVTGGSRGIGRAIAISMAKAGAKVIVNYASNKASALMVRDEIEGTGGTCEIKGFDVSDAKTVQDAVSALIEAHGPIHILVNNAGITRDGLFIRMKEAALEDVLKTNLLGAINCSRAVLGTMMKERWGRIINIGSVVAAIGNPGQANYCASKAGIEGFTKALSK